MDWYSKFIVPIWTRYKLWGMAAALLMAMGVITWLQWLGVDIVGIFNRFFGL